jgi:hypothetical protein
LNRLVAERRLFHPLTVGATVHGYEHQQRTLLIRSNLPGRLQVAAPLYAIVFDWFRRAAHHCDSQQDHDDRKSLPNMFSEHSPSPDASRTNTLTGDSFIDQCRGVLFR